MVVNRNTTRSTYLALEPLMTAEQRETIRKQAIESVIGADGVLGLTIAELNEVGMHGDLSRFCPHLNDTLCTAYEYLAFIELSEGLERFIKQLETLTPKQNAKEKAAQAACMKTSTIEGLLIFARDFFGLKSFAEAEKVTLAELLIAKKQAYNIRVFVTRLNDLMTKEVKHDHR